MSVPPDGPDDCSVVDGGKLAPESGGADAICAAIRRATAEAGVQGYRVEVRVLSPSRLAATVTTASGRTLPEQQLASSDRVLMPSTFDRFARDLAARIAAATP